MYITQKSNQLEYFSLMVNETQYQSNVLNTLYQLCKFTQNIVIYYNNNENKCNIGNSA